MVETWVPITIAAAFFQNVRSSLQKHLKGSLSTPAAAYVRFFYALPFVLLYLAILRFGAGYDFPEFNRRFLFFVVLGSTAQIAGTALLIHLFSFRNFVVATAYSKTETIQAAIAGMLILSDSVTAWALLAIVVSLAGVMLLAIAKRELAARGKSHHGIRPSLHRRGLCCDSGTYSRYAPKSRLVRRAQERSRCSRDFHHGLRGVRELAVSLLGKTAGIGLASGAGFGLAAVSYRAASLSLGGDYVASAACTLAAALLFQTVAMGLYLRLREPGQLTRVFRSWRISGTVGLAGMSASACWFTAMTIQNAAHVKALGQVELLFAFMVSTAFFRERVTGRELLGVLLLVTGILILLLLG